MNKAEELIRDRLVIEMRHQRMLKAKEKKEKKKISFLERLLNLFTKGENKMSDSHKSKGQTDGPINQHKALAEGKKVTGMKKGGAVHSDEAEDKKLIKKMVKKEDLKAKGGAVKMASNPIKMAKGGCMKKGGMAKKGK